MKKGIAFMAIAATLTLFTVPIVGCSVSSQITHSPQGDYTYAAEPPKFSGPKTLNFSGDILTLTSTDNLSGKQQKFKFYFTIYRNLTMKVNAADADYIAIIDLSTNKASYVKFQYIVETDTVVISDVYYYK
jgi:hypothetical protein